MNFFEIRESMVENQLKTRNIENDLVLKAMEKIPREEFVPEGQSNVAYGDFPIPIGFGQTISQPYIVAAMTQALKLKGGERILEIGTGSGYQAAILAEIADKVYTVERIKELADTSKAILKRLGYNNIKVVCGDGEKGFKEGHPYDGIIVTAGCQTVPEDLKKQLKDGSRIVIPIGNRAFQQLCVFTKKQDSLEKEILFDCRFVPLIGASGWDF